MKQQKYSKNNLKVVNTAKKQTKIKIATTIEEKGGTTAPEKKNYLELLSKFILVFAITIGAIVYGERTKLFEPDNSNNHTEHKWKSFYEFTETDTVDIIAIGTSKAYTALSPNNMTMALGANTFVLASPGTSMMDCYYCLKEALLRTTPKIVLIDAFCSTEIPNKEFKDIALSCQFKSFKARRNIEEKLTSMNTLFAIENIPAAWSNAIRNHNYIFRDTLQISRNKIIRAQPEAKDTAIYLGRYIRFNEGISDSVIALYDSIGAPIICDTIHLSNEYKEYSHKIVKLCNGKGITPIFVTYPMYTKHLKNYEKQRKEVASVINKTGAKWIDFQLDEAITNSKLNFENTYDRNQHMTRIGSYIISYKLASYIRDSFKIELPHRDNSARWHDMFYDSEGYTANYPIRTDDKKNITISKRYASNDLIVTEAFYNNLENTRQLFVKISKDSLNVDLNKDQVNLLIQGKYKGSETTGLVPLTIAADYAPLRHHLLLANLILEFEPRKIVGIRVDKNKIKKD